MNEHPYLRAYMAGIAVPTAFLLIAMTVFTFARYVFQVPLNIERIIVFPMAVVPNAWGLWNVLYVARLARRRVDIGVFGAMLAAVIVPAGWLTAQLVGVGPEAPLYQVLAVILPIAFTLYYLVWKHLVGSLNRIVGLA